MPRGIRHREIAPCAIAGLIFVSLAALCISAAQAADPSVWARCAGTQPVPNDQRLTACRSIIDAGNETPANRALAFCDRSIAHSLNGDVDLAVADISEALQLGLSEYRALMCKGYGQLYKGDRDAAIRIFDQAIARDVAAYEGFSARGTAYARKSDFAGAIRDFGEAIRRNPGDTISLMGRGNAFLMTRDYDRAIEDFTAVIKLASTATAAYAGRASAYIGKGDQTRASADLEEAKRLRLSER